LKLLFCCNPSLDEIFEISKNWRYHRSSYHRTVAKGKRVLGIKGPASWLSRVIRSLATIKGGLITFRKPRGSLHCERVAAQNHERNQAFTVGVGADQLGNAADGRGLGLDPAALSGQGGALGLEGQQYRQPRFAQPAGRQAANQINCGVK
jgi:hypothetical protein